MREQQLPVRAAIDIGSNTIHIVVARCRPDDLDIIADEVEMVRIGESVTASGEISPQKRDVAIATLRRYKELAQQHQADPVLVVATEAIRQASNSAEFLAAVKSETGLDVQLISGDVEATLTFYGATYELYKEAGAPPVVGVMDLGGGSTELVLARQGKITWETSLPLGSGWLHDRYLPSNPPTYDELEVARAFVSTYVRGLRIKKRPPVLVVTGGSANSLLAMMHHAFGLDMACTRVTLRDLTRCEGLLSALTAEENSQRYQQPVSRALILPAGALIIREMMIRLRLDEIRVSPHGIREGALLAYERQGEHWLEQAGTGDLMHSWREEATEHVAETFAHSGRRMLHERAQKMLDWRAEVLKDEDVEAVHKMRVASRRLRAVLDAYESCCNPKAFKKVYRGVKETADLLGAARDTDVLLLGLHTQLDQAPDEEQPALRWLIARLSVYREQEQEHLESYFTTFDEKAVRRQIDDCISKGATTNGKS